MKYFTLGSIGGGVAVSLVSVFLVRDTEAAFWQLCIGYIGFGCISGLIYAAALRFMAYALRRVTQDDAWRGLATGAIATAAQYGVTSVLGNHESDRALLFIMPICAAGLDAFRTRRLRPGLAPAEVLSIEPSIMESAAVERGTPENPE